MYSTLFSSNKNFHCAFFWASSACWRFFASRTRDVLRIQPMITVKPTTRHRAGKTRRRIGGPGTTPSRKVSLTLPWMLYLIPNAIGYRSKKSRVSFCSRWKIEKFKGIVSVWLAIMFKSSFSWTLVRNRNFIMVRFSSIRGCYLAKEYLPAAGRPKRSKWLLWRHRLTIITRQKFLRLTFTTLI